MLSAGHQMLMKRTTTLWSLLLLAQGPSSSPLVVAWQMSTTASVRAVGGTGLGVSSPFPASMTALSLSTDADASTSTPPPQDTSSSGSAADASDVVPFARPDRVVRDDLPTLYVYDHCPFCVRARFALGVKNVKHLLFFLANDDAATPTALVGKKIAPILEWKEADVCMPESMDICKLVDGDERFGPTDVILPATGRTDLKDWQGSVRDLLRGLQRPRYVATGLLPEFQQLDARHAFVANHAMPPYEKDEWKQKMGMAEKLTVYAEAMAKDPAGDVEELNRKLVELDDIVCSHHHCSPGGLSYDDVDLFSRLRSVTVIKDVEWPAKLRQYMDSMAELSDVPLYDQMAL